ncbi:hypothetical protein RRSWK_01508 [Rhodopirellula sp. SWK7]|nr:hypothetical protein RRSWK_01508 [Rhodopirellula sp. SWK7]
MWGVVLTTECARSDWVVVGVIVVGIYLITKYTNGAKVVGGFV